MSLMFTRALSIAALILSAGCGNSVDVLVLRNFTLISGTPLSTTPAYALTIENGRVSWVGPVDELQMPTGASTVDLSGKYLMPGLIDTHVHIGNLDNDTLAQDVALYSEETVARALETYAAYGVTSVLSMGTDTDLIFALKGGSGGETGSARVFTAGQGIVFENGYGGIPNLNHQVATAEEARAEVEAQARKGADVIKIWVDDELGSLPKMPAEISQAAINEAHRHGLPALAHVFYLDDAKALLAQGVDGFVHMVRDEPVDQAFIDGMREAGGWQMGTLSREAAIVSQGFQAPFLSDPFFTDSITPSALSILTDSERQREVASGPHYTDYQRFLVTAKENFNLLSKAGVNIAMGTDSGPPGRFAGYSAHWELELMVEAGLSTAQALTAATSDAARFLGVDDIGEIKAGSRADLLVLDANPLEDISNSRAIYKVYVGGIPVRPITE